jgi:cell pole-organizing protein PopZ
MSAAQPKSAEPSMEEILASIRRIISDDQAPKTAPVPATAPAAQQPAPQPVPPAAVQAAPTIQEDDDILDLPPRAAMRKVEPHLINDDPVSNDLSFEDVLTAAPVANAPKGQDDIDALMAAAEFEPTPPPPSPVVHQPVERLVSPSTDRMVSTAFSSLSNTVLANNARTLDDLVQDMMRPMIKSWLDDNLPGVVERLVRAEIERVSRGGR